MLILGYFSTSHRYCGYHCSRGDTNQQKVNNRVLEGAFEEIASICITYFIGSSCSK